MDAPRAPFVGRSVELARLETAVDAARSGSLRLVVIGGEAGVGKTRLLQECLARLDDERVLVGACLPLEAASVPYAPIVQALRELVRSLDPRTAAAVVGPARGELGRLLPELATGSEAGYSTRVSEPGAQARFFELILGVLERLAGRSTVVLAVEDIHWADPGTRDLITFLVRNLRRSRVLVLLTVRTDETGDDRPIGTFAGELERLDVAERIDLQRLAREDVATLLLRLTATRPTAGTVDRILARSDGNPFFIEQLVAAGESAPGLPPRLTDTLRARVSGRSEGAREILRAAAAAARPVDDDFLAEITGRAAGHVEAALREAVAARILVPVDSTDRDMGYVFGHALLREVIYDELHPAERRRLHRAVAAALRSRGHRRAGGLPRPAVSELAFHWDQAEEWAEAIPAHLNAAAAAAEVYSWTAAADHYGRALALIEKDPTAHVPSELDEAELLHRAADAAFLAADYPRAIAWGRAAIAAVTGTDPRRAGAYHVRLRWYLWDAGDREAAAAAVREALRLVPADPPTAERASALAQWSSVLMHMGDVAEAAAAAAETLAVARAVGARGDEAEALAMLGWIDVVMGRPDTGLAALHEAVSIADDVGDVSGIALGHALIAHMEAYLDRPRDALVAALAGYESITRLGAQRTYGPVLLGHATKAQIGLGDWAEADRFIQLGFDQELVDRPAQLLRIQRGRLAALRGSWDAAAADLRAARAFEAASGGSEYGDDLLAAEAELAARSGDLPAARGALAAARSRLAAAPPTPQLAWVSAFAMRAEADEAERARARRNSERERAARDRAAEILGGWPGPPATPVRELAEAELERLEGRSDPTRWGRLVRAWDDAERPFLGAEARYRQAQALLGRGQDRGSVAQLLAHAHATCARLGAAAAALDIARLAGRARVTLPQPAAEAGDGRADGSGVRLTRREAEVLRLVAGGWTNRQIADELFISPRTASVHVTNIFGKLGANSRVEAAAIAHRRGLAPDPPPPPDAATPGDEQRTT